MTVHGSLYYYAVRSDLTGGLVISQVSKKLLMRGIEAIQLWIFLIMVLTVFLASIMAYLVSRTFAQRVKGIVGSMELIGKGEFDVPILVTVKRPAILDTV